MSDRLIKDYAGLGDVVEYADDKNPAVRGTITGARRPYGVLFNLKTGVETPNAKLIQLRIKPVNGGRAFWTRTMKEVGSN